MSSNFPPEMFREIPLFEDLTIEEIEELLAVEPMLHVIAVHDEPRRVPLAGRLHLPRGCRVEIVGRARGPVARVAVGVPRVIEHLHLDRVPVDRVLLLAGPIEDAAVAARLDFPIDR